MEIIKKEQDGIATLSISGRLDAASAIEAEKEFGKTLDSGIDRLLVNLAELEYISSAGLRVLLVVAKRIQQKGGKVALVSLTSNVREVFDISGFSSIFKIFSLPDDSLPYLKS